MISCNIPDLPIGKADAELLTRRRVQKTDDIVTARGREDGETLSREAPGFGERFEVEGKNVPNRHDSSLLPWEVAQRLVIACAARTTNHPAKRRALRGDLFRVLGVHRLIEGARLALECLGAPLRDKAVEIGHALWRERVCPEGWHPGVAESL